MFESQFNVRLSVQQPTPKGGPGHELDTLARAARIAEINGHYGKYVRIAALLGVSLGTLRIIVDLIG
jgi:hypothetical protein